MQEESGEDSSSEESPEFQSARMEALQRQHEVHRAAMNETARLQQYRQQVHMREVLEDFLRDAWRRQAERERERDEQSQRWKAYLQSIGAEADAPQLPNALESWQRHEQRWRQFSRDTEQVVSVETVPWPPSMEGMLAAMVTLSQARASSPGGLQEEQQEYKQAYRKACLRWHPDTFQNKYSKRIQPPGCPLLMQRVHAISQSINDEWQQICNSQGDRRRPRSW